jgi:hypothetical protein
MKRCRAKKSIFSNVYARLDFMKKIDTLLNLYYNNTPTQRRPANKLSKNKNLRRKTMNKNQTVKEFLGTKFGNESSARVMNKINHAYRNRTRGEKLIVDLKGILKEEGKTYTGDSINPGHIFSPPKIIVTSR